jgi:hypothetical protein
VPAGFESPRGRTPQLARPPLGVGWATHHDGEANSVNWVKKYGESEPKLG